MHLTKSKKILVYIFFLLFVGSINNVQINHVKLNEIKNINVSGLSYQNNKIILNANTTEIQKARLKKNKEKQREQEIQELKKDVSDIKVLLTKLVEKND